MTTERFLLALRGMCSIIWSDNGKTFRAATKELQRCWRVLESDQTQTALSEKKVQWKFIVEKAPWWGGFYEWLVKSVKTPLRKLFAKAMLDSEQLTTILAETEAQLNSRPLTYLGADPDNYSVITPSQIWLAEIFKRVWVKTLVFQNRQQEPSPNVFSIIRSFWMDFGSCGMQSIWNPWHLSRNGIRLVIKSAKVT